MTVLPTKLTTERKIFWGKLRIHLTLYGELNTTLEEIATYHGRGK